MQVIVIFLDLLLIYGCLLDAQNFEASQQFLEIAPLSTYTFPPATSMTGWQPHLSEAEEHQSSLGFIQVSINICTFPLSLFSPRTLVQFNIFWMNPTPGDPWLPHLSMCSTTILITI